MLESGERIIRRFKSCSELRSLYSPRKSSTRRIMGFSGKRVGPGPNYDREVATDIHVEIEMITFRAMTPDEFSAFSDYFITDYANEIAANYGHALTESRQIAVKELADDLPKGISTQNHFLVCIEEFEIGTIGYLWYRLLDAGSTAFILDFMLFERFRGQGKGKATLAALEMQLAQDGVKQIKLRVAFKNDPAKHLYENVGFKITGFNMNKILK